jgi:uncharacterized protein (DUF952 family)
MIICHITTQPDWETASSTGSYQADTLVSQGFIHCSTPVQVVPVANRFYHASKDLVLLLIDPDKLTAGLVWENLEGGEEQYPHIYGPLNLDAVLQVVPFPPGPDGSFSLPDNLA